MALISPQRHLFDIPPNIAYFNCSYNAPLLIGSKKALIEGAASKCWPWQRTPNEFFDDAEAFRRAAYTAFGTSVDNFAIVPSASYGSATVARILEEHLSFGDEVIVLQEAFPSNYLPWLRLTQETGAKLVVIPTPDDYDWTRAVLNEINSRTKLIAVPNCHWTNGVLLDLNKISSAAKNVGSFLVLEVTQSLGANPIDIDSLEPDFLISAGYKWMLCPYGLSLFYADPKWHHARPLEETWLSREGAEDFENLVEYADQYQVGARRFEMGQKSIPSVLPGGIAALRQIGEWGVANIAETLRRTNRQISELLEMYGFQTIPEEVRSPNILGARLENGVPDTLISSLAERNVYISKRGSSLRFAPYLHNTENDIDRLAEALKASL
ncbi:aminotransferase class V-fold PLP-dependent enzyme [Pseudovibrio sp. Alg231-02]|uniref:aminotransferase class V-fold PLP-dependent enzyme n=1 Tax=Pseudovibrio sp. Alg231-02 TaxID=1922223 RepID=UPI00131EF187|nr:aminotransferase class V-fold PLP-dependent enzyme [Pseudovibrio sp. Alg231-02]